MYSSNKSRDRTLGPADRDLAAAAGMQDKTESRKENPSVFQSTPLGRPTRPELTLVRASWTGTSAMCCEKHFVRHLARISTLLSFLGPVSHIKCRRPSLYSHHCPDVVCAHICLETDLYFSRSSRLGEALTALALALYSRTEEVGKGYIVVGVNLHRSVLALSSSLLSGLCSRAGGIEVGPSV